MKYQTLMRNSNYELAMIESAEELSLGVGSRVRSGVVRQLVKGQEGQDSWYFIVVVY